MRAFEINGWMREQELRWLAERASRYERIIEVGSYHGRSTMAMLEASNAHIWCADAWGCEGSIVEDTDYEIFLQNMEGYMSRLTVVRLESHEAAEILYLEHGPASFDMVFIDGAHDYETVHGDITGFRPLIKKGGLLCGHDYSKRWSGVVKAVNELVPERKLARMIWWEEV